MQYFQDFLILATIHFFVLIVPGPDFAVITQQSVSHGRRVGLMTAFGISVGLSIHLLYTLLGFSLIIRTNETVFTVIKVLSALYLSYLGFSLIKNNLVTRLTPNKKLDGFDNQVSKAPSDRSAFIKGFITNASNPKATLFFLVIFTTIISPATPLSIQILNGLWMCLATMAWYTLVSRLFTRPNIRNLFLKRKKWFEIFIGIVLIALAIDLVT